MSSFKATQARLRNASRDGNYHTLFIAPSREGGGFVLWGLGTYSRESVLEGQESVTYIEGFDSLADAKRAFPEAPIEEYPPMRSQATLSDCPPSWFDPADAGETW